ncbi:MAG: NADH-quinone oxidoreductase subunit J [Phycisphaerales bacterium]|nr:NADH-quinone oxidoreductase subunit J [Phycisphaerales bacterium]
MDDLAFYIFAAVSLLSAIGIVASSNIVRSAVCLLGTLGGVACLYFVLDANLLAVIQLIVYAGGTLVLMVFGIMLTSKSPWVGFRATRGQVAGAVLVAILMAVGISTLVLTAEWSQSANAPLKTSPSVAEVGEMLLTDYLVPFEVASVLLLVVMIGAAYLARTEK